MLFMQPLFALGSRERKRARFGYADDISLLAASDSLESNCETLETDSSAIIEWARLEGLTFDAKKSELIHFTRRRGDDNPDMRMRLGPGEEHTVQPTEQDKPLRWLGVLLDRKLTFKAHVTAMAAKAAAHAAGIKALGNTVRGAPPRLLRQAVQACVVPVLCYGAEAWWPGLSRTRNNRTVSNRVQGLVHKLEVVQNNALRGTLPVYRTTPIPALHREAAIPPIQVTLDHKAALAAARIKRLDARHPLVRRTTRPRAYEFDTRLLRTAAKAGPTELHDPLVLPPWERGANKDDASIGYIAGRTKEEAAAECAAWAATSSSRDLVVYTDGSQVASPARAAGAGWVICQGPGHPIISRGRHPLPQAEVFDAEAVAALKGLQEACGSVRAEFSDNLIICLDNLEVARSLMSTTTSSSQGTFTAFAEAARRWSQRVRWLNFGPGKVIIRWVPGHSGIKGNEAADEEARAAAEEAARMPKEGPATLAWTNRAAKESKVTAFQVYWESNAPQRYKDLGIRAAKKPPELRLRRFTLGKLYASRSGHGDFAAYHKRFAHTDAQTSCQCGREKTPEHFYFCRLGRRATRGHWGSLRVREVLSTSGGATKMDAWLAKTGYFSSICSPYPPRDDLANDTDHTDH
jgi:ribonuclease HI